MEKDKKMRESVKNERTKLINLMLKEKAGGGKIQAPKMSKKELMTCETL